MECLKCKKSIPEDALFCPYCGKKQTVAQPRKRKKRANGMGTICKKSGNRAKPWEAQKNGVYISAPSPQDLKQKRRLSACVSFGRTKC